MKTVAAGAHYTTVTVDTEEEVKFSFASTSLSVEAAGGDITVALTDTAQAGDDETITVPDGESRMFIHHRMNIDTYYLIGSGTATLYASNKDDTNPFKTGKRGGDGGRTETVLYSAVDTTLGGITLSQAYTDYDVLYVGFGFSDNFNVFRRYMTIPTAMITFDTNNGGSFIIDSDPTNPQGFVAYNFDKSDATKINYTTKSSSGNYLFIKKIIGIKYGSGEEVMSKTLLREQK